MRRFSDGDSDLGTGNTGFFRSSITLLVLNGPMNAGFQVKSCLNSPGKKKNKQTAFGALEKI